VAFLGAKNKFKRILDCSSSKKQKIA